jgi:hypothetical protein
MPMIRNRIIGRGGYQHGNLHVQCALWISYDIHPMSIDFSLQAFKKRPQYARGSELIRHNTCGLTCGDILKAQSGAAGGRGGPRQICVVSRLFFNVF